MQNLLRFLLNLLIQLGIIRNLGEEDKPIPVPSPKPTATPPSVTRKVLIITHNPQLTSKDRTLKDYFGWHDPATLAQQFIDDLREVSYGYINYEIVEQLEVDAFPAKQDGFRYDEAAYLQAMETRKFHSPDNADYMALVREFTMIEGIDSGTIDEVWLFGHPYGGYYESIMCGPKAFWCNSHPLAGTQHAKRCFIIMGFNFERGVGEMLESYGHRAESIMEKVYERRSNNIYRRFIRHEKSFPGRAECGNVHYAPNSERDYDWGNARTVMSRCDTWFNFPDLSGEPRPVDSREWGSGDMRAHHIWWMRHFPHVVGETEGVSNNWWRYILDPNEVF